MNAEAPSLAGVRTPGEAKVALAAGAWLANLALVLSVVGMLGSLVLPAFIVSVWIYAAFHGGQLPSGAP